MTSKNVKRDKNGKFSAKKEEPKKTADKLKEPTVVKINLNHLFPPYPIQSWHTIKGRFTVERAIVEAQPYLDRGDKVNFANVITVITGEKSLTTCEIQVFATDIIKK